MAKSKNVMGNDPLAWLTADNQPPTQSTNRSADTSSLPEDAMAEVSLPPKTNIELVEESFIPIAARGEYVVADFYTLLFQQHPELKGLFKSISQQGQQKKLLAALVLLVQNLRHPALLDSYLTELGERHISYGVKEPDYQAVKSCLLKVLEKYAESSWSEPVASAWNETLDNVIKKMTTGAYPMEERDMAVNEKADKDILNRANALDNAVTAVMMIDRDFTITYANQSTLNMLGEHEETLRRIYPGFSIKGLVGSNIDMFHKNPAHQRQMLSNPDNLPHQADIKVGPLAFRLNVTAMLDEEDSYIGNMLEWHNVTEEKLRNADIHGQFDAINKVMGVISFEMDGTIIDVNENFLKVVGYSREDVIGKHHRMFATSELAQSAEYAEFWTKLNRGEFDSGEYKRIANGGKEIWLQASYNPILDMNGKPFKVVKFATDITETKLQRANFEGQISAINKAMGVISFNMDGTIRSVNDNFLNVVGYSREEVVGKHHRMFAVPEVAQSPDYIEFWAKLNRGEFDSGEYQRVGKDGKDIWLQASYNPIFDLNGKPYKVVKYASDITEEKHLQFDVQKALSATSMVMNALAQGDLTRLMDGEFEGEFALLQQAVNGSISKISTIVQDIIEASISISSAASEISQGNTDLSQRTEEQASSLQETAASMEELTSTVRQNSDNARQANQLAVDARSKAEKGGNVIQEAIQAMAAISTSSKRVADIIGVIDEIAFQTNLLALNAAVEAARAGEQGRGFAVVASEVRNLAQRSAAAAKEIKELINDSGEKVREGSTLVNESGKTLEEIVEGAKKVGDIISEIAAAGTEQTSGIEQVNQAVTQMDEMTQQNAALVEQAAAASESLDEQGKHLEEMMQFFTTNATEQHTPRQVTTPKASTSHVKRQIATHAKTPPQPSLPTKRQVMTKEQESDEWEEF
ncbi:hypothetical protein GCM10025856_10610 [Methylophaga marina]|uniref:PAS domain S-box protein n=1 Tax=Methylophaga marina TaxID=45495 RepID=A0ABP3DFI8_9GAMM|nr:methyl-accepting chemotaxis protein [Methylophaga marina]BDZ73342.1 hypothetical protein GCM10025856_10610 [Methylophaga marina]